VLLYIRPLCTNKYPLPHLLEKYIDKLSTK
jgi:hypothetical protein